MYTPNQLYVPHPSNTSVHHHIANDNSDEAAEASATESKISDQNIAGSDLNSSSRNLSTHNSSNNTSGLSPSILRREVDHRHARTDAPATPGKSPRPYYKSFEERKKNYEECRARIFGFNARVHAPLEMILKCRARYKNRQDLRRTVAALNSYCPVNDPRPYAKISINNVSMFGLLDTGASISCLGRDATKTLNQLGLKLTPSQPPIRTADGQAQSVKGIVDVQVTYNNTSRPLRLYIVPSLSQQLYLGIDFWKAFGLLPPIISELHPYCNSDDPNIHNLMHDQAMMLEHVKAQFPSFAILGLGKTTLEEHIIDTGNTSPIKQRHYPVSPAIQKLMYDELDRMLALGVIEESSSPWNSPVVLVRKPGKVRLCLDSRKVNAVTKKDAYPLPNIDGLLSRLSDTKFISGIDLKDAFWQIPLEKSSREKTAFTVPGRPLYHFKVMPFGLCNAPQRMCRFMDKVITSELRENVFVYLDDLLVISPDFHSHIETLRKVASCLRKSGLTINVEKSKFCQKEIKYLGYLVGDGCIKTDPDKIAAIKDFPAPRNPKQVRRFLGMTGWYRRFIRDFAALSAPISDCLKKSARFTWTDEAEKSFVALKEAMTTAPVLGNPDFTREFYIQCDASKRGVGGVLFQISETGDETPIAYYSQKLNPTQRNYSVTELECLAAVLSVKKFRSYVEGFKFTIITDHASLKWLMSQSDLNGRLARWSLKLQCFDFDIQHRKGSANIVADALSRSMVEELTQEWKDTDVDWNSSSFGGNSYIKLIDYVTKNSSILPDLVVREDKVFKRTRIRDKANQGSGNIWKLWVPEDLRAELIKGTHDSALTCHGGIGVTYQQLNQKYYWPNMIRDIRNYIGGCPTCKENKSPNHLSKPPMGSRFVTERPFQRLYTDLLGPYPRSTRGNTMILIVLDHFSKFVFLKPLKKATSLAVIQFFEQEIFPVYGICEYLHSDNGKQFVSKDFQLLLSTHGIKHIRTALYSPQANASERVNRVVIECIRSYVHGNHTNWDKNLHLVAGSLRNRVHSTTEHAPYHVVFGFPMIQHGRAYRILRELGTLTEGEDLKLPDPIKVQLVREKVEGNLIKAHEREERSYNLRTTQIKYREGQEVYRKNFVRSDFKRGYCEKFAPKYLKCRIAKCIGQSLYEVEDLRGRKVGVFHAKDLKA